MEDKRKVKKEEMGT